MTTLSRRNFLKLAAGTLSAAALPEPMASLLPQAGADPAVGERVELFVDDERSLVDQPPWEIASIPRPRREHFGFDAMSLPQRLEFWEQWASDDAFLEFLGEAPPSDEWTAADHAAFDAFEAQSAAWLDGDVSIDELSGRELAAMSEYGAAFDIFDRLTNKQARELGLYETSAGGMCSGPAIGFNGDVEKLNAALAALGFNVVVHGCTYEESLYEDDDWHDEEEDADLELMGEGA